MRNEDKGGATKFGFMRLRRKQTVPHLLRMRIMCLTITNFYLLNNVLYSHDLYV